MSSYPLYFQALVSKDDTVLKKSFPSFWYADVSQAIFDAQRNGWVMRPPGSVVVMGVQNQSEGIVRVKTCRSQTTQYWDLKAKNWIEVTPKGSPQVIDMVRTGTWLAAVPAGSVDRRQLLGRALSGLDQNARIHIPNR